MKTVLALILVCTLATVVTAQHGTSDAAFMAMMRRFFQMFFGGGGGGGGGSPPPRGGGLGGPPASASNSGNGGAGTGGTDPPCTGERVCMAAAHCEEPEPGFRCSNPNHICCDD